MRPRKSPVSRRYYRSLVQTFQAKCTAASQEQITPCTIMASDIIIQFAATYGLKNPKDFGLILMGVAGFGIGMVISVIGFWF